MHIKIVKLYVKTKDFIFLQEMFFALKDRIDIDAVKGYEHDLVIRHSLSSQNTYKLDRRSSIRTIR